MKKLFINLCANLINYGSIKARMILAGFSSLRGINCLSLEQTKTMCSDLGYTFAAGEPITFELNEKVKYLEVMPSGIIRINRRNCLFMDFGNRSAVLDFASPKRQEKHIIVLWSHKWLGFHHYLSEVAPKICRLKEELGDDLSGAKLCYPMIHRKYEEDLLELLGIQKNQVIDSKAVGGVIAKKLTAVPMAGWFQGNPNVGLLCKHLKQPGAAKGPELLYLKREGRRRCLNDEAIIEHCLDLGFTMVEELPRTISEQIQLYGGARVLVGPHGSAFTNMVWAPPGARVIEMLPTAFYAPFQEILSAALMHNYTKIACDNGPQSSRGAYMDFMADVQIVIEAIEREVKAAQADKNSRSA